MLAAGLDAALRVYSGVPLVLHQPTEERMREHYGKRGVKLNQARLRMATLPATAEVLPLIFSPMCTLPAFLTMFCLWTGLSACLEATAVQHADSAIDVVFHNYLYNAWQAVESAASWLQCCERH